MQKPNQPKLHILIDDEGKARTVNKGVKIRIIAEKHIYGKQPVEEIAEHYDITLADVYAALSYYHDNIEYYKQREAELKPLVEEAKRYSDELRAKIEARMAQKRDET